jgi:signal transduction histidine kinase
MNQTFDLEFNPRKWTSRSRLYLAALAITLSYLMVGQFDNESPFWARVNLPVSGLSVLLLCLAASETYLFIQQIQKQNEDLQTARDCETRLSQQLAFQRQTTLNDISRALIDRVDVNEIPPEVLVNIAQLFEADIVVAWVTQHTAMREFVLRGTLGLNAHTTGDLQSLKWDFPQFDQPAKGFRQVITDDMKRVTPAMLSAFCEREKIRTLVLNPVVRRDELIGIVGVFYRKPLGIAPALAAEMQTVANIIASVVQAEELYHDLVQAQKIESIGSLASGIAHDFNNVLAAILGCASYVKQHCEPSSPIYRYLEATEASALRGAALTKQLLSFARREGPRRLVVNPNDCIEQVLRMLERSFDKSILLQRNFAPDLRHVEIDPSQLEQITMNIAVNARDAMPDGGIFGVTTRNERLAAADRHRPPLAIPDGDYVVLGFRDTGTGMTPGTLKRLFEPFFTTKRPGKGTGLGMSVVQGIVHNCGGEIRVESEVSRGTLFEVYLPVTTKPLPCPAPVAAASVRGGHECILLAEDEEVIREMAQLGLEAKGYKVIAQPDGARALAYYREHWEDIDLVVADMAMPRMGGPELFAGMKEINPNVRVIVSSGYSHDQEGERMLRHGCLGFLQKPYDADQLAAAIRGVLDSGL